MLKKQIANTSESGKDQRGSTSTVRNKVRIEILSVRCLVSLSYWKGLISAITLSIVVPQAIGIFLRNRIGDSTGDGPCFYLGLGAQWT